jgi:hypothetical protein
MSGADAERPQSFELLRATRLMWNASELKRVQNTPSGAES